MSGLFKPDYTNPLTSIAITMGRIADALEKLVKQGEPRVAVTTDAGGEPLWPPSGGVLPRKT